MLNRRPLLALIAAELISSLGSLMTVVALPWFVLETTGSPVRMSIVLAAEPLLCCWSGCRARDWWHGSAHGGR